MEIIARLREERQALVARIVQIDKMLRQYDEWGREAQRLLSLTATTHSDRDAEMMNRLSADDPANVDAPAGPLVIPEKAISGDRSSARPPTHRVKTPIREFEVAVIDVLREAGQPMDRVALYEALTARGIVIGNGNRDKDLNALSARVYRMARDPRNRISGERGQGYRLMKDEHANDAVSEHAAGDKGGDDPL